MSTEETIAWARLLTDFAPPITASVVDAIKPEDAGQSLVALRWPWLSLFCTKCNLRTQFEKFGDALGVVTSGHIEQGFATYVCRNCSQVTKTFALSLIYRAGDSGMIRATKIGEVPAFGGPFPGRLRKLLGPSTGVFMKGWRSENLGFGVGAFTYYRRVADEQKNRLLDEILKVAKASDMSAEVITTLERAKAEPYFSQSVDIMKDAIPDVLRYKGHNPMVLLNSALGHDIHDATDQACLEYAGEVRVMLEFIAERIGVVLEQHQHVDEALAKLQRKHEEKKARGKTP